MIGEVKSDASIIRAGDFVDPTAISATISLPAAVWERLTADLRDDDRISLGRPELPDTPLAARIALSLEMQLIEWEGSVTDYKDRDNTPSNVNGDLEDGVPF